MVNSPCGVRNRTNAPGIRSSLQVLSTMLCSAVWSIGLSVDVPTLEFGEHATAKSANVRQPDVIFIFMFRSPGSSSVQHSQTSTPVNQSTDQNKSERPANDL